MAKMTVSGTPGTGTITLNAASAGFQTFAAAGVVNGEIVSYSIVDGSNWEVGRGTYTSAGTSLTRGAIWGSSGANTAINLTSAAVVEVAILSEDLGMLSYASRFYTAANNYAPYQASGGTGPAAVAGDTYYVPIYILEPVTLTGIGVNISVASLGATAFQVGIYSNVAGVPGSLLASGGVTSTATGQVLFSFSSPYAAKPGWYFFGVQYPDTTVTFSAQAFPSSGSMSPVCGGGQLAIGVVTGNIGNLQALNVSGWKSSGTPGTMPPSPSAAADVSGRVPWMYYKVTSAP
jgi:hypothetical protein